MSQEVLLIRSGKIKITIYDQDENFVEDVVVATGDVIMLTDGGHSFEWLEDGEVIEIKQGPYLHSGDKVNFTPANSKEATA